MPGKRSRIALFAALMKGRVVTESGCWISPRKPDRYGYVMVGNGKNITGERRQHRRAWVLLRGPIPKDLVPDHTCRNRACFNPDHIEWVTNQVNVLRGNSAQMNKDRHAQIRATRDTCAGGHPWNDENIRKEPRGIYTCRLCKRATQIAYRQKIKEAQR
jgi:hypothetical protein